MIPDFEVNRHYIRSLSSDSDIQRRMLLAMPEIDTTALERTMKTAHAQLELSRSRVGSSDHHALAAVARRVFHSYVPVGRRSSGGGQTANQPRLMLQG